MKYCLSMLREVDTVLRGPGRVLIATDFDGTLCPIADTPSEVHLRPATLEILRHATTCPRLTMAVISGRALADIRHRLPLNMVFAGNHGLEIAGGGIIFEHDGARQVRPAVAGACEALTGLLPQWPAAWVEDKGLSATLHFRQVDQRHHNTLLHAARHCVGAFGPQLSLRVGKRALEVRPKVQWDKGSAFEYIRERAGPFDACICLGDDRTDESMFRANRGQLNVRIGCALGSAATHYLSDPTEAIILLSHIVDICGSQSRLPWRTDLAVSAHAGEMGGLNNCER